MMKLLTTAAGLLFAIGIVTTLILGIKSPSSAFGQAIKQLRKARSMSYAQLMTVKSQKEPVRTKVFIAEDGAAQRIDGPRRVGPSRDDL